MVQKKVSRFKNSPLEFWNAFNKKWQDVATENRVPFRIVSQRCIRRGSELEEACTKPYIQEITDELTIYFNDNEFYWRFSGDEAKIRRRYKSGLDIITSVYGYSVTLGNLFSLGEGTESVDLHKVREQVVKNILNQTYKYKWQDIRDLLNKLIEINRINNANDFVEKVRWIYEIDKKNKISKWVDSIPSLIREKALLTVAEYFLREAK